MSEPDDGPWDAATEHDDQHAIDPGALHDDPPTTRATLADRIRARAAARPNNNAPSVTLPPPDAERRPAKPATPAHGIVATPTTPPAPAATESAEGVVLLDTVARASAPAAPLRSETAAGGIVVVATGSDAERVRKLCHAHGLLVPVMSSLSVVHESVSVIVIGEPSPPAPERVVHIARPSMSDDMLLALLRALAVGRVVVDPPAATNETDARVRDFAQRIATLDERTSIEQLACEAITAVTGADRAQLLLHDPSTGTSWSESRRGANERDERRAMGLVGWCAQTGQAVHASPAGDDPRYLTEVDDPEGKAQSRVLVQPVIGADRRVHAVLVAARRWRRSDFTAADRTNLRDLAALIASTIDLAATAAAGSTSEPRRQRSTLPGVSAARAGSEPSRQSALAFGARPASDSRPPPVTARRADSKPPPLPPRRADSNPPALPAQVGAPTPAAPVTVAATPAAPPAASPPAAASPMTPTAAGAAQAATAPAPREPIAKDAAPAVTSTARARLQSESGVFTDSPRARPTSDSPRARPTSDSPRMKRPSGAPDEPFDVAVVATEPSDVSRVNKMARKARLEISVLPRAEDAPPYYRIVTIGQPWTPDTDPRVVYAARSTLTDEMLTELLVGLATDRAPAQLIPLKPHGAAEARRLQLAFAGSRKLAAATDLGEAETIAVTAIRELADADRAYCLYFDGETGALWSETRKRAGGDDRRAIAGIVGWCARTGRAASVGRASSDPRWLGPLDDADGDPNSQLLVQPIIAADRRVTGVLVAVRRPKRPGFAELDASVLAHFAALAAPLLEQLALAVATQTLLRDSTAAPDPDELRAVESPVQALVRRAQTLPRWSYAVGGAVLMGLVFALARC